jgi:hypothetical protein
MEDMLIKNSENIFFNAGQQLKQVIMEQFAGIDHGNQHLVLNS